MKTNTQEETQEEDIDELDVDTQRDQYLTFRIGKEDYGIGIAWVMEIVGIQAITVVPDMPKFVKGVINLRGRVIPVMDVRLRFGLPEREYDDRTCVIVTQINEINIGLVVDTVNEVMFIPENTISPPPKTHKTINSQYILGMGKVSDKVKIILDIERLISEQTLDELGQVIAN